MGNISILSCWEENDIKWDDDDDIRFILDKYAKLDLYSAGSLKQQSVSRHIAPLGDTLSWCPAKQSLLLLLNAVRIAEKQQIPIA